MHLAAEKKRTIDLTVSLIRKDTSNPPGSESAAADVLAEFFRCNAIDHQLIEPSPGRVNVIAQIGPENAPTLYLVSHLDVVPPGEQPWQHDPFGGEIIDGEIWGRGAVDTKQVTAIHAVTMAMLKPLAGQLKCRVMFLGTADEEKGSKWGLNYLVEHHPRLFSSGYALTEGGGFTATLAGQRIYLLDSAQTGTAQVDLSCTQPSSSHPGMAPKDTPLRTMLKAVNGICERQPAIAPQLGSTGVGFLSRTASILGVDSSDLNACEYGRHRRCVSRIINRCENTTLKSLLQGAVRNTYSANMFRSGSSAKKPPTEASAGIKAGLLPGVRQPEVRRDMESLTEGCDVDIAVQDFTPGYDVGEDNRLFEACCRGISDVDPDAVVVPFYAIGRTDGRFLAPLGIKTYGFAPLKGLDMDEAVARAHGTDERLSVESLRFGLDASFAIIKKLALES